MVEVVTFHPNPPLEMKNVSSYLLGELPEDTLSCQLYLGILGLKKGLTQGHFLQHLYPSTDQHGGTNTWPLPAPLEITLKSGPNPKAPPEADRKPYCEGIAIELPLAQFCFFCAPAFSLLQSEVSIRRTSSNTLHAPSLKSKLNITLKHGQSSIKVLSVCFYVPHHTLDYELLRTWTAFSNPICLQCSAW